MKYARTYPTEVFGNTVMLWERSLSVPIFLFSNTMEGDLQVS